jgi:hypothetical protein
VPPAFASPRLGTLNPILAKIKKTNDSKVAPSHGE